MKKLMVLDGNSIVNRAFYGVSQNLTTRAGQPTNAIFGFLNILQKLLDEGKPDALCVTFDRKAPTFRHLAYEGYKTTRKGMPLMVMVLSRGSAKENSSSAVAEPSTHT